VVGAFDAADEVGPAGRDLRFFVMSASSPKALKGFLTPADYNFGRDDSASMSNERSAAKLLTSDETLTVEPVRFIDAAQPCFAGPRCSWESHILFASQLAALYGSVFYVMTAQWSGTHMTWTAEEYLAKTAECEEKAQAAGNIDTKAYYLALAEQWRTLATINKIKQARLAEATSIFVISLRLILSPNHLPPNVSSRICQVDCARL
jgi:hypothetical protein